MYHLLTTVLTSPILGSFVGVTIALTLLGLLVALRSMRACTTPSRERC